MATKFTSSQSVTRRCPLGSRRKLSFTVLRHLSPACKALSGVRDGVTKVATLHVGFKPKQHGHLDGVICVNKAELSRIGAYAGYVSHVPNWLPEVKDVKSIDLRARLGLPPEIKLVGAVGRLHPSKGNDVLISAFLRVVADDAALVIAGDGPQRAALERLSKASRRIHLGFCEDVAGFLQNLDLFVSPSREESAGLAILEAMSEGLPIITTATDGPSEYLKNYPVRFVQAGSVEDLSAALTEALRSEKGPSLARIDYDMDPFARATGVGNVLWFYSQVAASKKQAQ
ncbi:glycosyltransferase involved in cell wall biosynthesis [Rhizobium sp. BK529]|uniref:glycosyltransferase family 4 protein n=1 Tax=Rhizobium sp. BK529 TaxID=2586983 RepID=UPI00160E691C|nr:glycosyltransferase family 4 protein [Rhizobium sp. BK529]MBB3594852.1 glycosyltransferase involved in cell wall biosynthesis [Rhizobium sp. BK529]